MTDYRIGVDIGGTFTDIVFLDDDGRVLTKKISSSVDNYAKAIVDGITEVFADSGLEGRQILEVLHGTTIASNAILELKGARIGLIATKGFRDILEIRNLRMPRLYDLRWEKPAPLVERYLRLVVDERIDARGNVQRPLECQDAERVVDRLAAEGVEAIAVCLINSYANPAHERLIAEVIAERAPELAFCISYDVLPEIKEYERTSTTVVNTYVMPVVSKYLKTLRAGLDDRKIKAPLLLMQSNGGLTTGEEAAGKPVNIVESGPAAGVVGAQAVATRSGYRDVISFDMGGTTAKASLIEDGAFTQAPEHSVGGGIMIGSRLLTGGGYLLKVPAIDLAEVGAGGGSIVWIDSGGSMQIGPESAGAFPGPLCYDQGGTEPTVTDASVILGYLNPEYLVGGELALNAERSRQVFADKIAKPLGLDLEYAAYGARQIAIANMIRAIKAISSERGRDPRGNTLFAFGGNGALFAAGMAHELGMKRIVVPPSAGLFSAFGLLYADVEHHYSRTIQRLLVAADPAHLNEVWNELEETARRQLATDGFPPERMRFKRAADMHYKGQIYELTVAVPDGVLDAASLDVLDNAFGEEHHRTYGHRAGAGEPVELVNAQIVGQGIPDRPRMPERLILEKARGAAPAGVRNAYFGAEQGWLETPVVARADLETPHKGPCIVEEYDTTCLVPPGATASLDASGNIIVELG